MCYAYILRADGYELVHECTYHTEEALKGATRRVYPRFHAAESLLDLSLVADQDADSGVSCCRLSVENTGDRPARLSRADAGVVLRGEALTVHYFQSDWGSEFSPRSHAVTAPFSFGSVAGRSSKGYAPFVACETPSGVTAMTLAWSGNWTCAVLPPDAGRDGFLCTMGLYDGEFEYALKGHDRFTAPEVLIAEGADLEEACLKLRRFFRDRLSLVRRDGKTALPVVYNTWWPYEDKEIDERVYAENAAIARALGCDDAMLDAGWFGESVEGRTWYEKRGDWENVNAKLFPSGLKALCDDAKRTGIEPGIWCEIEAVGRDAALNAARGDIIARRGGKSLGYVCFGSKAGRDWAMGVADRLLGEYGAKWIKFDFNLDPGFGCDCEAHGHGPKDGLYAHYTGYYKFLDELHAKYPDVIIENCSSGGLRNDVGILRHTHFGFMADPDETVFHLQLFWGSLSYLHQSALYHFSWSETTYCDHNLKIRHPITEETPLSKVDYMLRAVMMGVMGLSYKLPELPDAAKARLKELIAFYRAYSADFILNGDAYRLTAQPLTHGRGERFPAFEFVSRDGRAMVFFFRLPGAKESRRVYPRGLTPDRRYTVTYLDAGTRFEADGAALTRDGLAVEGLPEEGSEIVTIE